MHVSRLHIWLLSAVGALALIGAVNLVSALQLWGGGFSWRLAVQHGVFLCAAAALALTIARTDYRALAPLTMPIYLITLFVLVLVLLVGREIGGNKSWFAIGGFGIQPSEGAKLTLILLFARMFGDVAHPDGASIRELCTPLSLALPILGLILLQHDFGTTLLAGLLCATFLCLVRLRWLTVALLLTICVGGAFTAYHTIFSPAQRARIFTFLHPENDPRGRGYHVLQAKLAVGSGGAWGRGFLQGRINKLKFLPEKHTDFVFPVLAEEWGFAGGALVLAAYGVLLAACVRIAQHARERFGALLAAGLTAWFFWQLTINLGGVLGLLPLTGVTLPFLSYGGTSTLMNGVMIGLLLAIHRRRLLHK